MQGENSQPDDDLDANQFLITNKAAQPLSQQYMPLEADEALKKRIRAPPKLHDDHLRTVSDLLFAHLKDEAKQRLFGIRSADQRVRDAVDAMVALALKEMQDERATVVGLVSLMIREMLDMFFWKELRDPEIDRARTASEVQSDIVWTYKTLARLHEEWAAFSTLEGEARVN